MERRSRDTVAVPAPAAASRRLIPQPLLPYLETIARP